jgi:uncharacterized membrane protein SirB2
VTLLKFIHLCAVVLSATGFLTRGIWSFRDRHWRSRRWVRILPHTVDSVLLLSGLAMVLAYHWSPLSQPWLMTKLLLLLVYILLGMVALRWGGSRRVRFGAWVLALMVFAHIIAVAVTKDPLAGLR